MLNLSVKMLIQEINAGRRGEGKIHMYVQYLRGSPLKDRPTFSAESEEESNKQNQNGSESLRHFWNRIESSLLN